MVKLFSAVLVIASVLTVPACDIYESTINVDQFGKPLSYPATVKCFKCDAPADWDREGGSGDYVCPVCNTHVHFTP
jgi:uncharacterized lipoprotein